MSDKKTFSIGEVLAATTTSFALGYLFRHKLYYLLPKLVSPGNMKLVLVVRTDLGMKKGKIASQCAHAAVACYKEGLQENPRLIRQWEALGQPKIVVQIEGEQEIMNLARRAADAGLISAVVRDAGRTQVQAGSRTVVGIGPDFVQKIDKITGSLKLL